MKTKQILCIILFLLCILSGCSKTPTKDTSNVLKGRSVENNLALPKDMKADNYYFMKKNNKPFIYGFRENPCSIVGYQLDENGTWVEATPAWLKSLTSLQDGWSSRSQILMDANGIEYLYYTELINDHYKGNLLCSKDGTTYETLKPEGWEEIVPAYGGYKVPSKVTIMDNGTLAAVYYTGEAITYDSEKYKIQKVISDLCYDESLISSIGNQLILGEKDNKSGIKSLIVYNLSDSKSVKYPFKISTDSNFYCDTNEQNIFLCNVDGIFKLEKGTSVWNCILDGTLTSLAMPTMWSCGFVCDSSNNYYILFNSKSGYSLKQYSFDATVETLPPKKLNIYGLADNATLRQAAAVFQIKHKNVKVNIKTVMDREEYDRGNIACREDYIRALNTELLADNNYDILLLDGLPTDSFIEKGILTDISELLQPMINDGTLLKNIMDSYVKNGKSYCVPTRFAINLTLGRYTNTKMLTNLQALSEYTQVHPEQPLFGKITMADLTKVFIPYQINSLLNKKGKIDRQKLIQTLTLLKQIGVNCGIVEKYDKKSNSLYGVTNYWNILEQDYHCIFSVQGLQYAMYPFGMLKYVKGFYTSFDNSFTPSCEIGIISKGKQQELSKEFLLTLLSEDVQKNDLYDGFAVNSKALMECPSLINKDNIVEASISYDDGRNIKFICMPLDENQTKEVLSICTSVNKKLSTDGHIAVAIEKKTKDFFTGNQSAAEAADAILEEMNIYLAE